MAVSGKRNTTSNWFIWAAINLVALPISAWQTYKGFEATLEEEVIAIGISALTTVLFLGLNLQIAKNRLNGEPVTGLIFAYILPLTFSFMGNFTAFFTSFAKEELAQNQTLEKVTIVSNNLEKFDESLPFCLSGWGAQKTLIQQKITELQLEASKEAGGWGAKSKKHFDEAYLAYGQLIGSVQTADLQSVKKEQRLNAALQLLNQVQEQLIDGERNKVAGYQSLRSQIQSAINFLQTNVNGLPPEDVLLEANGLAQMNDQLVTMADTYFAGNSSCTNIPGLKRIQSTENIGGFGWAFASGFVNREDDTNLLLSTSLALVLDLGVLIFMILLNRPVQKSRLTQNTF